MCFIRFLQFASLLMSLIGKQSIVMSHVIKHVLIITSRHHVHACWTTQRWNIWEYFTYVEWLKYFYSKPLPWDYSARPIRYKMTTALDLSIRCKYLDFQTTIVALWCNNLCKKRITNLKFNFLRFFNSNE